MKIEQIIGLEEAKETLTDDLTLRALKDTKQKMVLLEGASGGCKTTLVKAIAEKITEQYPNRFVYKEINTYDVTAHVTTTSERIHKLFSDIRRLQKPVILFIDEYDEIMASRLNAGHIKIERTSNMMRELNTEIPNLYIIAATNRPKMIDRAVLDRFHNRINCPLPTDDELSKIIDVHLDFLIPEQKQILYKGLISATSKEGKRYNWNGRDIKLLSDRLLEKIELGKLQNPDYKISNDLILKEFGYMVNSKAHLKDDYLENQD